MGVLASMHVCVNFIFVAVCLLYPAQESYSWSAFSLYSHYIFQGRLFWNFVTLIQMGTAMGVFFQNDHFWFKLKQDTFKLSDSKCLR